MDVLSQAKEILWHPYSLDDRKLQGLMSDLLGNQVDWGDFYFQQHRSEGWSLDEGVVKSGSFSINQGVGVRAVLGDKTALAYTDDIRLITIKQAVQATGSMKHQGQSGRYDLNAFSAPRKLYHPMDPIASWPDQSKVDLLHQIEVMARAEDVRVTQVMASVGGSYEVVLVYRSDGAVAADIRPLVRVNIQVIVMDGVRREQGSSGGGGRFGYEFFSTEVLQSYVRQAVSQAVTNLDARPAPAGTMTVVLGNGWPGVLLHEAVGHGLEGDFNRKGSSAFAGRMGQKVAATNITVVDDGTLPGRRGSLNCDDEGQATSRTVLIENGILTGYLQDQMNAGLMKMAVTGNGRRESYAHLPMPRMTNTYALNGPHTPEEIIRSVKRGLYATQFGGGQVDITSGKFVFSTTQAWMIEDGRLTYPVKGATLIGNGPDVLTKVSMVGNDMALDAGVGVCGKEGQSVPVGVGQPTLKVDELTVGGTVG